MSITITIDLIPYRAVVMEGGKVIVELSKVNSDTGETLSQGESDFTYQSDIAVQLWDEIISQVNTKTDEESNRIADLKAGRVEIKP